LIIGRTVGFDCKSWGEEYNYGDLIRKMEEKGYEKFPGFIFEAVWQDSGHRSI
jgi:hypothetical protein